MQRQRAAETEADRVQDYTLHLANIRLGVRIVCDVFKVADFGRVHLLVLGGDEHRRHADQLQPLPIDVVQLKRVATYERQTYQLELTNSHVLNENLSRAT